MKHYTRNFVKLLNRSEFHIKLPLQSKKYPGIEFQKNPPIFWILKNFGLPHSIDYLESRNCDLKFDQIAWPKKPLSTKFHKNLANWANFFLTLKKRFF